MRYTVLIPLARLVPKLRLGKTAAAKLCFMCPQHLVEAELRESAFRSRASERGPALRISAACSTVLMLLLLAQLALAGDNWPQFRGPTGDGLSDAKGLPLAWSEKQNIKWKTEIHGRGWSSPVIWGDQIWLTTAPTGGKELFAMAIDRQSGRIIHDIKVFDVEKPEPIIALNSYASCTPVIEAGRAYVHFGSYGTACLDTSSGKTLWERRDLKCNHFRGPGSSPILFGNLMIVHFDGFDLQYVVALDKLTGKTVWKTDRSTDFKGADGDLRKGYGTPLVISVGGKTQMLSAGSKAAMSYDPATGEELWQIRYDGFNGISRPLFAQGLALISSSSGATEMFAVRPDGRGDVTQSHVAWKLRKGVPIRSTPVIVDDLMYMVNDNGIVSCVEIKSGSVVWQSRLSGEFSASPVAAAGRVYLWGQEPMTTVIAAGREYKVLAENKLDEGCMASPAVSGKAIVLRTKTHLYRIEE
jgi:outer membrane protein assembly factor BamB